MDSNELSLLTLGTDERKMDEVLESFLQKVWDFNSFEYCFVSVFDVISSISVVACSHCPLTSKINAKTGQKSVPEDFLSRKNFFFQF